MKRLISHAAAGLSSFFTPVRMGVLAVAIGLISFFVLGDKGVYQFKRLIEMKNKMLAERATLNERIDRLAHEREILSDPDKLEMIIRSELGYIKPGEIVFEEKSAPPQTADNQQVTK